MSKLTTHVLDVFSGKPANNVRVELYYLNKDQKIKIASIKLNKDGRSDPPLLDQQNFKTGKYEMVFYIGEYFKKITELPEIPFLDDVVVKFGISDEKKSYHVPLLVSPWSYSTYRGS